MSALTSGCPRVVRAPAAIPVRHRDSGRPSGEAGRRRQVQPASPTQAGTAKDRWKTKIIRRGGGKKNPQSVGGAAESEAAAAEKMREQIKTFETVLNVDQFLVSAHVGLGSLFFSSV